LIKISDQRSRYLQSDQLNNYRPTRDSRLNAPSVPDVLNYSQTERRPRGMQISEGLFKGPMLQNRMYNKDRWEQTARWKKTQEVDYTPPTSSPASIGYASFRLELFRVVPGGTRILNCALRRVAARRSTGPRLTPVTVWRPDRRYPG